MDSQLNTHLSYLRDTAELVRYEVTRRGGGFGPRGEHRDPSLQDVVEKIDALVTSIANAHRGVF